MDGRTAHFYYNALGEETSRTDVLGVTTTTAYDAWNQPQTITRQAVPGVGALATTTTLTPDLLHKQVSVTVDGKTLTTVTDFDAFGRVIKVTGPDGSHQEFTYDGFGQKSAQTPLLLAGQTSWGYETWIYDDEGRVTGHYDRVPDPASPTAGRQLSATTEQPTYETKTIEGVSIPGI